jgi:hypothetical protein
VRVQNPTRDGHAGADQTPVGLFGAHRRIVGHKQMI